MSERNTLAHFMHDAGLAAWFGGSLMGAIGVNGAAADVDDPRQRARVANSGWSRWTPFNAAAIGMHLLGGAQLLRANKGRVATQKGVLANTNVKLALTAGALGATAYARLLGQKVIDAGDVPVAGGTAPTTGTPLEVAKAQKQLKALQWAIPGLTGAVMASSALHEEQQRPSQVMKGQLQKLPGLAMAAGTAAGTMAATSAKKAAEKVKESVPA
jgi:enoyl-CoA hydratase/carnithine racemase